MKKLIEKIGYPQWDKSVIVSGRAAASSRTGADSVNIAYVPFVRDSQDYVNAALAISTAPGDTSVRILCDWQYRQLTMNTPALIDSAERFALFFMMLDKIALGNNDFLITDSSLFKTGAYRATGVRLEIPASSGRSNVQSGPVVCISAQLNLTFCVNCPGNVTVQQCWDEYYGVGGAGSGTGGGSGGSGSGGGGWVPPVNPNPCGGLATRTQVQEGCGVGWVPTGGGGGNIPPVEPYDSLLRKAARLVNKYRDSLANLCELDTSERFFNIVQYNNEYDTFRIMKSKSSEEVNPNYYMLGGRILLAEWHYHPKYPDGTSGSWPSGGDVSKLTKRSNRHVMIIDTYEARYALVVEDSVKFSNWQKIAGNGPGALPSRVYNSVLVDPRSYSTGATYLLMTKEKLLAAIGSSGNCGIGLYSTTIHGTTFIKEN